MGRKYKGRSPVQWTSNNFIELFKDFLCFDIAAEFEEGLPEAFEREFDIPKGDTVYIKFKDFEFPIKDENDLYRKILLSRIAE